MFSFKKCLTAHLLLGLLVTFSASASLQYAQAQESEGAILDISTAASSGKWYGASPGKYTYSRYTSYRPSAQAAWTYTATENGTHDISVRASWRYPQYYRYVVQDAPYTVSINGMQQGDIILVNQRSLAGEWYEIGAYDLNAGDKLTVTLTNETLSRYYVIADAVKISVSVNEEKELMEPIGYDITVHPLNGGEGESSDLNTIHVFFVHDQYAEDVAIEQGTTIRSIIEDDIVYTNNALQQSGISTEILFRGILKVDFDSIEDYESIYDYHPPIETISDIREDTNADLLFLYTGYDFSNKETCAYSNLASKVSPDGSIWNEWEENLHIIQSYLMTRIDCVRNRSNVVAHEFGHLLGAAHQQAIITPQEEQTADSYARAYIGEGMNTAGKTRTYGTMVTNNTGIIDIYLPVYSTPNRLIDITYHFENKPDETYNNLVAGTATEDNARAMIAFSPRVSCYHTIPINGEGSFRVGQEGVTINLEFPCAAREGTFTITSGSLPDGLFFDEETMSIRGTVRSTVSEEVHFSIGNTFGYDMKGSTIFNIENPLHNADLPSDVNNDGDTTQEDFDILERFISDRGEGQHIADIDQNDVKSNYGYVDVNNDAIVNQEDVAAVRLHIPSPLQNPANPLDVDNSGYVAPVDALIMINDINSKGPRIITDAEVDYYLAKNWYIDTSGDGILAPVDILLVVDYLNNAASGGEGEFSMNDVDGDGISNTSDNCSVDSNANQKDSDSDGIGDVCDDTPLPAVDAVSLSSVSIIDGVITIQYAKNFATCAHIRKTTGYFNQRINFICGVGEDLTATTNISNFNDPIAVGDSIKLCHGNNGNICSEFVTITE